MEMFKLVVKVMFLEISRISHLIKYYNLVWTFFMCFNSFTTSLFPESTSRRLKFPPKLATTSSKMSYIKMEIFFILRRAKIL
jgi:hypothetical protein